MRTSLAGLTLASPVLVASGCGGTGPELAAFGPLSAYGTFTTRSITLDPRPGAAGPRLAESPSGLVHATGLPNPGIDGFLATELPWLVQSGAKVVVSVVGRSLGELAELARRLGRTPGVAAVEINLATPDPVSNGVLELREPQHLGGAVAAVARELPRGVPVLAKLRADPVRVVESARIVAEAGAGAVVVGGALPAALPDGRPAGLSGPAIAPLALRCVREVALALREADTEVDVVGCGGVHTGGDVRAFLDAGAVAVAVGSALFHDPTTAARLAAELTDIPADTAGGTPADHLGGEER
ncbi:beta/alpha barrel domain-containing protein [Nocardioides acrostichi]|uniref:tRNA-dihydrouridine synthase n=1 Tax=Nocardioides acrostichi TaxID=2784339 RepID=A0A930UYG4_9ACTN|nr:tRNA-dihydrouridine synthase [Nocardioides acrostichi]MBF4163188.1 tRNA-dihydrouridine synthase [Nocardioides acrostichi]